MTDDRVNNTPKQVAGVVKDAFRGVFSRITDRNEVTRLLLTATGHTEGAPPEEVMQRLLRLSYESAEREKIVGQLVKRLHVRDWRVVLRTCLVCHRLLSEGPMEVSVDMLQMNIFTLSKVKPLGDSPDGRAAEKLIRWEVRYLEELLHCLRTLGHRLCDDPFLTASLDQPPVDANDEKECLPNPEWTPDVVEAGGAGESLRLLLEDGRVAHVLTSRRLIVLIDHLETGTLAPITTPDVRSLLQRFSDVVEGINTLVEMCQAGNLPAAHLLPPLHPLPIVPTHAEPVGDGTPPAIELLGSPVELLDLGGMLDDSGGAAPADPLDLNPDPPSAVVGRVGGERDIDGEADGERGESPAAPAPTQGLEGDDPDDLLDLSGPS